MKKAFFTVALLFAFCLSVYPSNEAVHKRIKWVLSNMKVVDVNRDGKVDCIDYSVAFYKLYGDNAQIIHNKNPRSGMNHLFIRIWDGNGVLDIEPQGTPDLYMMSLIWGTRYDPYYNNNVTSSWGQM